MLKFLNNKAMRVAPRSILALGGAAIIALSAANTAQAQDDANNDGNWYGSLQIGIRAVDDVTLSGTGVTLNTEQHNAFAAAVALGYRFGDRDERNFRVELQGLSLAGGDPRQFSVNGTADVAAGNALGATGVMLNGALDFGNDGRFTPFIGAGIGYSSISAKIADTSGNTIDDSAGAFTYQVFGGVGYELFDALTLTTELRYLGASSADLQLVAPGGTTTVSTKYSAFTAMLGLRIDF